MYNTFEFSGNSKISDSVHMIPGVSQRKSYAYFDSRYILTLIGIRAVCTKESARFDKKVGVLQHIS